MGDLERAVTVSYSNDAHLTLLTIKDPAGAVRLVDNLEPVVSRGQTFLPYPFSIVLPTQDDQRATELQLSIDNVDQRLIEAIRKTVEAPDILVELILSSKPDAVYRAYDYLKLVGVQYNAVQITGTLISEDYLGRAFPAEQYKGSAFPDLFY